MDNAPKPSDRLARYRQQVKEAKERQRLAQMRATLGNVGQFAGDMGTGLGEVLGGLASNAALGPLSGLAGLAAGPMGGNPAQAVQAVQGMAYQPDGDVGQRGMANIAGALSPISGLIQGAGDGVYENTGSPMAGAGAQALTAGALQALPMMRGGPAAGTRAAQRGAIDPDLLKALGLGTGGAAGAYGIWEALTGDEQ